MTLTVNVPDFVGHSEPHDFIRIIQGQHMIHTEKLGRFHLSPKIAVLAALEGDCLTPLIGPCVG